ncbi:MAG: DNA primase [Minisyncoccia bacterium]|jgi:DNA primase
MNRTTVEEIKARLPIEEVIGSYMKLERAGKSLKARCPFHNEKTPSFFVSPERGGYYCFGCGAKGDIFSFVEQFEGLDFKGALKILAERAGVPLVFDQKADSEKDKLFQITEEAAKYFEEQFVGSKEAAAYVKKRGVSEKTSAEFRIGFAPEGWRNLYAYLRGKDWPNELIEKAGLAKKAEDGTGNYYDRFRGRVMFPLNDSSGRVIAFSGRILPQLDDGNTGKYLNSPDTPLFDKSSVLYGLDKAKSFIRRLDYSILVEGQMDLIMSHQAGVKNAVAASGTALSDAESNKEGAVNNLGLLRRLSGNVIIAFDSDAAGRKAAMRAAGIALSLGMDVKIADIQGGKDPADLVFHDPEDWKKVLRAAKQVIEFEINNILREFSDERKRLKAVRERVYPLIVYLEKDTDKQRFVRIVREEFKITNEVLIWDELNKLKRSLESKDTAKNEPEVGSDNEPISRIDLVERRMFGLLDLMEKAQAAAAAAYRDRIMKAAGDSYAARLERIKPLLPDFSFEAEAFYGAEPERWDIHMDELIANFEEDLLNGGLIQAMNELRAAERAGDQERVAELARKCQDLSIRKAEVRKRKK